MDGNGYKTVTIFCKSASLIHKSGQTIYLKKVTFGANSWAHVSGKVNFFHGPLESELENKVVFKSDIFPSFTLEVDKSSWEKAKLLLS